MKVNRSSSFVATFTGLQVGSIFGPSLTVAESVFFTEDANKQLEATIFLVICTTADGMKLKAFVDSLPTRSFSSLREAQRELPKVQNIPIGTLMRSYEKETQDEITSLRHEGSFAVTFRNALNGLMTDGTYTQAQAQQALNVTISSAPTQTIECVRQTAVRTTRGAWVSWLDYNLH